MNSFKKHILIPLDTLIGNWWKVICTESLLRRNEKHTLHISRQLVQGEEALRYLLDEAVTLREELATRKETRDATLKSIAKPHHTTVVQEVPEGHWNSVPYPLLHDMPPGVLGTDIVTVRYSDDKLHTGRADSMNWKGLDRVHVAKWRKYVAPTVVMASVQGAAT